MPPPEPDSVERERVRKRRQRRQRFIKPPATDRRTAAKNAGRETALTPSGGEIVLCGAKTRAGGICRAAAMPNGRCKIHGGMTPAGPASANWKTGRYSRYLPSGLREAYIAAASDIDLLNLTDEIALVDVRTSQLLGNADAAAAQWLEVQRAAAAAEDARAAGGAALDAALDSLRGALAAADGSGPALWSEVMQLLETRRRLAETERKRRVDQQLFVTVEQAMTLVQAVVESVRIHVSNRKELAAITNDLSRLLNGPIEAKYNSLRQDVSAGDSDP